MMLYNNYWLKDPIWEAFVWFIMIHFQFRDVWLIITRPTSDHFADVIFPVQSKFIQEKFTLWRNAVVTAGICRSITSSSLNLITWRLSSFGTIPSLWWQVSTILIGAGCSLAFLLGAVATAGCCFSYVLTKGSARLVGMLQLVSGSKVFPFIQSVVNFDFHLFIAVLFIIFGAAVYPIGWYAADVKEACGSEAGIYNLGKQTALFRTGGTNNRAITITFSMCLTENRKLSIVMVHIFDGRKCHNHAIVLCT